MSFVSTVDHGPVQVLTMSAPDRRNAVPDTGWSELEAAFGAFERSGQRALIVTGAGDDFCAGADLSLDSDLTSAAGNAARMRGPGGAATALFRITKPTIAAVDGAAVGAGMNLALGCDIVVATADARFSEIFVRRGLAIDFGGTWLLPRLVGLARAREIALTGRMVPAAEALAIGMVAAVVDRDELQATAMELAEDLAAGAPLAQRFIKAGLGRSDTMTFEQALAFEEQAQAILLGSADFAEGVAAFLGKRPPGFSGR